jgi:dTMP kinase
MLLFSAARHDIWERRARPALKSGIWVIASHNYYSTLAYQGYGEGLGIRLIEIITSKSTDKKYMSPDFAAILSLDDIKERIYRIGARGELEGPDNFESKDEVFQSKVQRGYLDIANKYNIPVISATQPINKVTDDIWAHVEKLL